MDHLQKMFWILLITALVTSGFIFSTQNSMPVAVQFAIWSTKSVPLALTLFLAFGAGFLISYVSSIIQILKLRTHAKKLKKLNENLEKEVHSLRNQPLLEELSSKSQPKSLSDRTFPPSPKRTLTGDTYDMEDYN